MPGAGSREHGDAGAESAAELIQKGDVFYDKLQAAEALKYYLPAEKLDPNNVRLLVRIARQYRHLMSDATKVSEKAAARQHGGELCAAGGGSRAERSGGAARPGDQLREDAAVRGNKEQIANSRLIKIAADKVIALDPSNDLGLAVLGRWYLSAGRCRRGEARSRAGCSMASCRPRNTRTRCAASKRPSRSIPIASCTTSSSVAPTRRWAETADARKFITKGLAMPETEKDDPETKRQGREILGELR